MNGLPAAPMNGPAGLPMNGLQPLCLPASELAALNGPNGPLANRLLSLPASEWPLAISGWPALQVARNVVRSETRGTVRRVCDLPGPDHSGRALNGERRGPSYWTQVGVRGSYLQHLNRLPYQGLCWLALMEEAAVRHPGRCSRNGDLLVFLVPRDGRPEAEWRRQFVTRCRLLVTSRYSAQLRLDEAVRLWSWRAGLLQPEQPARRRMNGPSGLSAGRQFRFV